MFHSCRQSAGYFDSESFPENSDCLRFSKQKGSTRRNFGAFQLSLSIPREIILAFIASKLEFGSLATSAKVTNLWDCMNFSAVALRGPYTCDSGESLNRIVTFGRHETKEYGPMTQT